MVAIRTGLVTFPGEELVTDHSMANSATGAGRMESIPPIWLRNLPSRNLVNFQTK